MPAAAFALLPAAVALLGASVADAGPVGPGAPSGEDDGGDEAPAVAAPSRSVKLEPADGVSAGPTFGLGGGTGARSATVATDAVTTSSLRAVP